VHATPFSGTLDAPRRRRDGNRSGRIAVA
jgi:hypothetical protein